MKGSTRETATGWRWLELLADPLRIQLVRCLSQLGEATAPELANLVGTDPKTMRRHLETMVQLNLVHKRDGESDGQTAGRPATRFWLNPALRRDVESYLERRQD